MQKVRQLLAVQQRLLEEEEEALLLEREAVDDEANTVQGLLEQALTLDGEITAARAAIDREKEVRRMMSGLGGWDCRVRPSREALPSTSCYYSGACASCPWPRP